MKTHEELQQEWDAAIEKAGVATESQMREMEAAEPNSTEELADYIKSLVERPHDYGTCVYAMSLAAVAAFNYVASCLGVTGFQTSCADLDFLRLSRGLTFGRVLDFEKLLFPQYLTAEHFPSVDSLLSDPKILVKLGELAKKNLADKGDDAHPDVVSHWKRLIRLADGVTPKAAQ